MKKQPGFSLIEITLVVVIASALIGSTLFFVKIYDQKSKIEFTQRRLAEIKEALLNFAAFNGYLPCPAIDDKGKEARAAGIPNINIDEICNTYDDSDGYLPWDTLGIGKYFVDGWGHPFRYRVDGYFSNSSGIFKQPNKPVGCTKSPLEVRDRQENPLNLPDDDFCDAPSFNSNIVAIIFSCGKNTLPDHCNDYDYNCPDGPPVATPDSDGPCDNKGVENTTKNLYIQDTYLEENSGIVFDDLLIWVPKYLLISRLAAAGKWPP